MPRRELIVISDGRGPSGLRRIIENLSVKELNVEDIKRSSFRDEAALLIDIDLRDISNVLLIKNCLPTDVGDQCRMIAIDRGSRQSEVQAKVLGATVLLRRPFNSDAVRAPLERLFAHKPSELERFPESEPQSIVGKPGGASIVSAAAALSCVFAALTRQDSLYRRHPSAYHYRPLP
jgi:hypothetical protein